ncbi:hypothetical protein SALBM311S_11165 [Streptomyces alboniger]
MHVWAAGCLRVVFGTRTRDTSALAAAATALRVKASVKPSAAPCSMPDAATVDNAATPIEPPTSWKVLTTPEASPDSSGTTRASAVVVAVTKTAPIPSR